MAISIEGLRILRLLKKTAAVYLLLLFVDRPLRVTGAARLLEIDRETARKHLLSLASIGLVRRSSLGEGFILTGMGRQLVLGEGRPTLSTRVEENPPEVEEIPPPIVVNVVKDSEIYIPNKTTTTNKPEEIPPAENQAVWEALWAAGIKRNPRTEQLARREYLTPDYVTGHFLSLKRQGMDSRTGLLVTILESGSPAPALNANRHLKDCDCQECQRLKYRICPYCGEYPCECEG
jgi:predicted DNA-binding transcriptional regulator